VKLAETDLRESNATIKEKVSEQMYHLNRGIILHMGQGGQKADDMGRD
jgi:hypothetical protein